MKGTTKVLTMLTAAVFILAGCAGSRAPRATGEDALNVNEAQIAICDDVVGADALITKIQSAGTYCQIAEQIVAANVWLADINTKLKVCPDYAKVLTARDAAEAQLPVQMKTVAPFNAASITSLFLCNNIKVGLYKADFKCSSNPYNIETAEAMKLFTGALVAFLVDHQDVLAVNGEFSNPDAMFELILSELQAGTNNPLKTVLTSAYSLQPSAHACSVAPAPAPAPAPTPFTPTPD